MAGVIPRTLSRVFLVCFLIFGVSGLDICWEHLNTYGSLALVQPQGVNNFLVQVSQSGVIRKIAPGGAQLEIFLDVSTTGRDLVLFAGKPREFLILLTSLGEQGLLSLAFHPQFSVSGDPGYSKFYIYYTRKGDGVSVLSEWVTGSSFSAVPSSYVERIILTYPQPYANHNGGTLLFGPSDGFLYLSLGGFLFSFFFHFSLFLSLFDLSLSLFCSPLVLSFFISSFRSFFLFVVSFISSI